LSDVVQFQPSNAEMFRVSFDAAAMCREIVLKKVMEIQGRRYLPVEGWQAIATAHGCVGSACEVERIEGGVRAKGQVKRMSDGLVISEGEGFVGEDEPTWFGGTKRSWKWGRERGEKLWFDEEVRKRPDYAIRAMAQTRAISRACRSAFAHVLVLIDENLSATPAEEILGLMDAGQQLVEHQDIETIQPVAAKARPVEEPIPYGRARAARQEAAQAARPAPRPAAATGAQARPEPSQRPQGSPPEPTRIIQRTGAVPTPPDDDEQAWRRWLRGVCRRLEGAKALGEVEAVCLAHSAGAIACDKIVPGALYDLNQLADARKEELGRRVA
jgi:hypothetical protein